MSDLMQRIKTKIPLLEPGNKGILKTVGLRVERNGVTAHILRGESI